MVHARKSANGKRAYYQQGGIGGRKILRFGLQRTLFRAFSLE